MRSRRPVLAGLLGVLALSGCGAAPSTAPVDPVASSARNVQVTATFTTAPSTAITYDEGLVPAGSRGAVSSRSGGGSTTVMLAVRGLETERRYGAHVHTQPCGATGDAAGPHFQYEVDPVQPSVDPRYANPDNEIWLDVTTDGAGAGSAETTVAGEFPEDRQPRSVVGHAAPTETDPGHAGSAGNRAACISVDF
jgi:superoxide dismutase, Cu-Zn family